MKKEQFKNNRYLISNIMTNKKFLSGVIIIYIIFVLIFLFVMSKATYQREVVIITINGTEIQDFNFGFQTLTLMQGFFNTKPDGELRVYYSIKDNKLNQIFSVGEYKNVGNGFITITNLDFPVNGSWEARVEIGDKNLNVLNEKCSTIKFEVINGVKKVSQENC